MTDGATLQTGIGGVPSQIAKLLAEGDGGDYGIHSEMFTTGLMHLHQAGKVTNRKGLYDGFSVSTDSAASVIPRSWRSRRFRPIRALATPRPRQSRTVKMPSV